MTIPIKQPGFRCTRCAHAWIPRSADHRPVVCPQCKSAYWSRPRRVRRALAVASLLLGLLASSDAFASLALVTATADRVVFASDSRTWDRACDCSGGDTARKVDTRDGIVFAVTGSPAAWRAWQAIAMRPDDTPTTLGQRLIAATTTADAYTLVLTRIGPHGRPETFAARVEDGQMTQQAQPTAPFALALGWDDNNAEKPARLADLATALHQRPAEAPMVAAARRFIEAAAQRSPKVGGPTHVVVLDTTGARWQTEPTHWDGSTLVISSGNLVIDDTSIRLTPSPSAVDAYDVNHAFAWAVSNGYLGSSGWDTATARGLTSRVNYTGPNLNPYIATSQLQANYTPSSGGTAASASVNATSTNASVSVQLLTQRGGSPYVGEILIGGVPDFLGATSGSAGSVAGYIHITVNGTPYRLPYYTP